MRNVLVGFELMGFCVIDEMVNGVAGLPVE